MNDETTTTEPTATETPTAPALITRDETISYTTKVREREETAKTMRLLIGRATEERPLSVDVQNALIDMALDHLGQSILQADLAHLFKIISEPEIIANPGILPPFLHAARIQAEPQEPAADEQYDRAVCLCTMLATETTDTAPV